MGKRCKALVVLALLWLVALLFTVWLGDPRVDETSPVSSQLPPVLGSWSGHAPLFCQRESCLHALLEFDPAHPPASCPSCEGALAETSLIESQILPAGTRVHKMIYQRGYEQASVSLVITGTQRSGIHRPQWCLPSQGYSIQSAGGVRCQLASGRDLRMAVLAVTPRGRSSGGGLFAYWFADRDREVASHWERLYWMAYNDLVLRVRRPWAYVSVWMPGATDERAVDRLLTFVKMLYPSVRPENLQSSQDRHP